MIIIIPCNVYLFFFSSIVLTLINLYLFHVYRYPYKNNAHRWLLGPLLNQPHISHQFYIRDIKFLHRMLHCNISIVNQCIMHASHDANTLIGYKL